MIYQDSLKLVQLPGMRRVTFRAVSGGLWIISSLCYINHKVEAMTLSYPIDLNCQNTSKSDKQLKSETFPLLFKTICAVVIASLFWSVATPPQCFRWVPLLAQGPGRIWITVGFRTYIITYTHMLTCVHARVPVPTILPSCPPFSLASLARNWSTLALCFCCPLCLECPSPCSCMTYHRISVISSLKRHLFNEACPDHHI